MPGLDEHVVAGNDRFPVRRDPRRGLGRDDVSNASRSSWATANAAGPSRAAQMSLSAAMTSTSYVGIRSGRLRGRGGSSARLRPARVVPVPVAEPADLVEDLRPLGFGAMR